MAYRLQIVDNQNGFNFNVRYENLSKIKKPAVIAKTQDGKEVKERTTFQGQILAPGSTQRQWVDTDGNVYSKGELTYWYGNEQVQENTQTKVFEIVKFEPLSKYTDDYVMDKYYEIFPDTNGMKKDFDKEVARKANLVGMRKLWEHLDKNQVVARGEMNVASKGFLSSDGYLRAIKFGNKWGVELGIFREEKIFEHLQESIPQEPAKSPATSGRKKLKMV